MGSSASAVGVGLAVGVAWGEGRIVALGVEGRIAVVVGDGKRVVVGGGLAVADGDGTDVQETGVAGEGVGVAREIWVDTMTTPTAPAVAQQQSTTINTTSAT